MSFLSNAEDLGRPSYLKADLLDLQGGHWWGLEVPPCISFTSKSETLSPAIKVKYLGCQGDASVKPWVWIISTYITLDTTISISNAFILMGGWKQGQETALKLRVRDEPIIEKQ